MQFSVKDLVLVVIVVALAMSCWHSNRVAGYALDEARNQVQQAEWRYKRAEEKYLQAIEWIKILPSVRTEL